MEVSACLLTLVRGAPGRVLLGLHLLSSPLLQLGAH